ncbi:YibE/F family protein [Actinomyces graevenitzii]|uniref:YibE/F family protein n=1 Tax=Actinomyces graevenitzii TaxID=55565 RepID=UPI000C80A73A|nr:YibE/F family protein [Actinomyces graevenitzii]PMC91829.1 YibE/F family protein [Actinomyces graevenitzii]
MSHAHGHGHAPELAPQQAKRVRVLLAAIVVPLVLVALIGLVAIYPSTNTKMGSRAFLSQGSSLARLEVTSLDVTGCQGVFGGMQSGYGTTGSAGSSGADGAGSSGADGAGTSSGSNGSGGVGADGAGTNAGTSGATSSADSSLLKDAVCAKVIKGKGKGLVVPIHVPTESRKFVSVGDQVNAMYTPAAISAGTPFIFIDFERAQPVGILALVYLVVVVAVAGRKGVLSILGLAAALAVLVGVMIPALLAGTNPVVVVCVCALAMLILALYLAHGISVRTTTALLGTVAGLVVTVILAQLSAIYAHLNGASSEDAIALTTSVPGINMSALLVCGMVLAGLGVLNDVTITQASAVWELHGANPTMGTWKLARVAMRIGRDHIASTVYTLAFAYAGSALPLIMVAALIDRSVWATILSGEIAEEVVRTLVSSIGLVLAIPATTLIAAFLSVRTADKAAIADGAGVPTESSGADTVKAGSSHRGSHRAGSSHRGSHRADNGGASARGASSAGAPGV